jgi:hypothetical protein
MRIATIHECSDLPGDPAPARRSLLLGLLLGGLAPAAWSAGSPAAAAPGEPTAEQVVERHVAARGGLAAWRALQALSLHGRMDAGPGDLEARAARIARAGSPAGRVRVGSAASAAGHPEAAAQVQLPFTLEMKRPHKSRIEIEFGGRTALQVFDGTQGWLVRPYLNRSDAEPFTPEQLKAQAAERDLDGPLVDYAAKGTAVKLAGVAQVDGRDAYDLELTTRDGRVQHVWIDTRSYLDVKVEGLPRRMDGRMHRVWVTQRDFRPVQGLMMPFVLETAVEGYRETHRTIIDKAAVNPNLDDARFAKPRA